MFVHTEPRSAKLQRRRFLSSSLALTPIPCPSSPKCFGIRTEHPSKDANPERASRVAYFASRMALRDGGSQFPPNPFRIRRSASPLRQLLYNPQFRDPLGSAGTKGLTAAKFPVQLLYHQHLRAPIGSEGNTGLITPLQSALTQNAPVTRLESALPKKGGGGPFQILARHSPPFTRYCSPLLFSYGYNRQIPQLLSFDIHANWWGGVPRRPPVKKLTPYCMSALPHHSLASLFSLFAQRVFHNSFAIRRFRTLSKNCRVAVSLTKIFSKRLEVLAKNLEEQLEVASHFESRLSAAAPLASLTGHAALFLPYFVTSLPPPFLNVSSRPPVDRRPIASHNSLPAPSHTMVPITEEGE